MDIVTGLSAASAALKLIKELRGIDSEVDKAGLKLRLIELTDMLLEAKEALQDAKQERSELMSEIERLKTAMNQRAHLEDEHGRLYEIDDTGARVGEPYCNLCFVKEELLIRMRFFPANTGMHAHHMCDNCGKAYT